MKVLLISVFGVSGVLTRYFIDLLWGDRTEIFPVSTLTVNLIGCFLAGLVYALLAQNKIISEQTGMSFIIGFCGGLTTFSGYCLQSLNIMSSGEILKALFYIILSISLGFICIFLGLKSASYL